jgi:protein phosphatase
MRRHLLLAGVSASDSSTALRQAVEAAHQTVYAHAQQHPGSLTMGTTLTAALLHGAQATFAQVGDSRAYLFRGGSLILLTRDQTIGNLLRTRGEDSGLLSGQIGEMLTQAVGAQADIEVIMSAVGLESGDVLLLCSDGLYKVVSPGEMVDCLEQVASTGQKARDLVEKANGNGGPDNVTVILAEIQTVEKT